MALDIEQLAARWVLGQLHGKELAGSATQALLDGYDGPALREIAGTAEPLIRDVADVFERALDELRARRPSRKQAALILAKAYAARIVDGSLSPYAGAKAIWQELTSELRPDDHTLDPFIYWADEFEETRDPERRKLCESAIFESARELMNS
jgi:hypothetical protein